VEFAKLSLDISIVRAVWDLAVHDR
jgi:hypothetical protein